MLATASKPRGDSSSEREMKLPAALLMRSVRGPVGPDRLDHLVDGQRVADVDAVADHTPAMQVHQFGRGLVAHDLAAAADMDLGAELEKPRGHGFAEAGAAAGHENAPPGEKLIVEHRFHPKGLSVNWSID